MTSVRRNDKYRMLMSIGIAYVPKSEAKEFRNLLKIQNVKNYKEKTIGEIVKFER
ncbi:hypothetical protein K7B13_15515 [Bacillus amyloliquefaciens]|uniref:hypothetical protein n=1 Tax=Bacillus amyloliquefaciens TaxID=1390 RepID=UPI001CA3B681|nr:hypothetical protein [Bacillus amyloliquefaciens]QZY10213.1 hypothetical protein K7B13_10515 [Bacillus amyloliquefaciens]QZY11123.1 hypothetical protein K7B13_15515 [Bacillus amyloliquefaciens]